jgi:hypothetical protein
MKERIAIVFVVLGLIALAFLAGTVLGHARGIDYAYSTNPVSERLDEVCAGLWVSEQNRIYMERAK